MIFFDLRTLAFIFFLESFLLGSIFLVFSHFRKKYPGTRELALSLIIISLSMILFALQNPAKPFLTIVIPSIISVIGGFFTPYGFRKFFGYRTNFNYYASLTAITFISTYYNVIIEPANVKAKLITLCLVCALTYYEAFYLLFFNNISLLKNISRATSATYFSYATFFLVRIYMISTSGTPAFNMINAQPGMEKTMYVLTLVLGMLCVVCAYTMFILMVNFRLEGELIENEKQLRRYAEDLEKTDAAKGKFISIISHDLRNPVDGMISLLGTMVCDKDIPPQTASEIELLKKTSDGLAALLANLLDWAKAQTKNIECRPENISLNEAISETMKILEIRALQKKISVNNEIDGETRVLADRKMLSTMLRNLIYNAIKFTDEEGKITISSASQNGITTIMIRDNGVGMKKEALERVFSLDRSNYFSNGTAGETGTGLGLLICKEFAELNGGTISIASEPGAGTTVTLIFSEPF